MKTTVILLALLCGAAGQDKVAPGSIASTRDHTDSVPTATIQPNSQVTRTASSLSFTVAAESNTITAKYLVVVQSNGGEPIIRIGELPYEKIINQVKDGFWGQPYRYLRPEKPEELKIELWTADGKKWEPVWREVK